MGPSALGSALLAQALFGQTVQGTVKIRDHGPSEGRYDLVFLAEGYTASEQEKFVADVTGLTDWLLQQTPFDEFEPLVNVTAVKVLSASSGISGPGEARSTAFATHTGCVPGQPQSACVDDSLVKKVLSAAARQADVAVVVLNTDRYAGMAGRYASVSMSADAKGVLAHELGHAIAGLADEYEDAYPGYPDCGADDCPEPNVSPLKSRDQVKWSDWIEASTPIPTPQGSPAVGLFEGARYKVAGLYRPVDQCRMRHHANPFCPVCAEALGRSLWRAARLGAASPEADLGPSTSWRLRIEEGSPCPATGCSCGSTPSGPAPWVVALAGLAMLRARSPRGRRPASVERIRPR